jgi:hypothetical protein
VNEWAFKIQKKNGLTSSIGEIQLENGYEVCGRRATDANG